MNDREKMTPTQFAQAGTFCFSPQHLRYNGLADRDVVGRLLRFDNLCPVFRALTALTT